jgi:xanthine/uracil permease
MKLPFNLLVYTISFKTILLITYFEASNHALKDVPPENRFLIFLASSFVLLLFIFIATRKSISEYSSIPILLVSLAGLIISALIGRFYYARVTQDFSFSTKTFLIFISLDLFALLTAFTIYRLMFRRELKRG